MTIQLSRPVPTSAGAAPCVGTLAPGDRVLVLHADAETTCSPGWPDWADQCDRSDWAHWSRWAAARGLVAIGLDVSLEERDPVAALTHVLWWDPSLRAVLVAGGAAEAGTCVDAVREAIHLTGSAAALLVDTVGATVR